MAFRKTVHKGPEGGRFVMAGVGAKKYRRYLKKGEKAPPCKGGKPCRRVKRK